MMREDKIQKKKKKVLQKKFWKGYSNLGIFFLEFQNFHTF